jgi:hypothetical protein
MESVEEQLSNFDALLFDSLEFQLIIHTNRTHWEEYGYMNGDCLRGIEEAIDFGFEQMFHRYKHSQSVLDILESWHEQLHNIIWIAMDCPFPRNLDQHVDRVIANCRLLFYDRTWGRLEQAMIQEVSRAQIIQRNWKEACYNPKYEVCKKRIRNWTEDFSERIRESRLL